MLEKIKQMKHLKTLQDSLKKERVVAEKEGVQVVIAGNMQVQDVCLNPELSREQQEIVVRDCFNEALRKLQLKLAQEMMKIS